MPVREIEDNAEDSNIETEVAPENYNTAFMIRARRSWLLGQRRRKQ